MRSNKIILSAALLALSSIAAADTLKETVPFADLNLSNPAGVAALYHRIHAASRRVCDPQGGERNLKRLFDIRHCLDTAIQTAILRVGNAALTQYCERQHRPLL